MKQLDLTLAEKVAGIAAEDKLKMKDQQKTYRLAIVCLTILLLASIICGTVIAVSTIVEQQYALNAQNASLYDLLAGAEVTTEEINANDGGTAIYGNGNTTVGGDYNG